MPAAAVLASILASVWASIQSGLVALWAKLQVLKFVKILVAKILALTVFEYRRPITFTLAFLTTFNHTIRSGYEAATGIEPRTWTEVGYILLAEAQEKFLGSASHIAEGLRQLLELQFVSGIWNVWTGVAAIIMLLFIWVAYREWGRNRTVDLEQKAMVFTILFLTIAVVEGAEDIQLLLDRLFLIIEVIASQVYDLLGLFEEITGSELPVNETSEVNTTTNSTNTTANG